MPSGKPRQVSVRKFGRVTELPFARKPNYSNREVELFFRIELVASPIAPAEMLRQRVAQVPGVIWNRTGLKIDGRLGALTLVVKIQSYDTSEDYEAQIDGMIGRILESISKIADTAAPAQPAAKAQTQPHPRPRQPKPGPVAQPAFQQPTQPTAPTSTPEGGAPARPTTPAKQRSKKGKSSASRSSTRGSQARRDRRKRARERAKSAGNLSLARRISAKLNGKIRLRIKRQQQR